jgi:hypothetical protein
MPRCAIELVVTRHDGLLRRRSGGDMRKGTDYRMLPMRPKTRNFEPVTATRQAHTGIG